MVADDPPACGGCGAESDGASGGYVCRRRRTERGGRCCGWYVIVVVLLFLRLGVGIEELVNTDADAAGGVGE